MVKHLRFNFSDYSAEQQEKDASNHVRRQVYLMKVDGEWGHLIIKQLGNDDIDFYPGDTLFEVYDKLKESLPNCQPKVIQNRGLENYLRDIKQKRGPKPKVKNNQPEVRMLSLWEEQKLER